MRQGQQNRRSRGRGRKQQNPLARNYESNGPDVKIRGTAQQITEKYMSLARDMVASGDMVSAENYFQHAEHYARIIMAAQAQNGASGGASQRDGESAQGRTEPAGEVEASAAASEESEAGASSEGEAKASDAPSQRRSKRRSSGGRKSSNGEGRKASGAPAKGDGDGGAGEFAGLPPSISTPKMPSKTRKEADGEEDANAVDDAAPDAIAS